MHCTSIIDALIMPFNAPYNALYDLMDNNCNHKYNTRIYSLLHL